MGEAAKPIFVEGFKTGCHVVLRGRRGTVWHYNMFHTMSKIALLAGAILLRRFQKQYCIFRGRRNTLETSDVILRGRRSTLDVSCCVFCESHCQRCAKWWQGENSVAFSDMSWKSTEALHETSILRSVRKKTRRKTSILKLQSVKFEEVSHKMIVLMLQHVSSRVAGFFGAVAVSMGEAAKPIFVEGFKTGCHVVLRGRRGTLWHYTTCFILCQKSLC